MKLSIIVPVYNVRPFLEDCLASLVNQTVKDYELILVDDGSSDGSAEIIERYAKSYPKLIKTLRVENGGQGRARNFGIDMASGEFLGFVDSDDWVVPEMYEKLIARAEETDADLVYCDLMGSYADGRTEYLPCVLHQNKMSAAGSACNKLFRRQLVGDVRFPTGLWYEDFSFSAKLLMKTERIEYVREALYVYRCGQESTMHNNNAKKNLDIIEIMDGLESFIRTAGTRDDFEFLLINHVLLDSINRIYSLDSPEKKESIARLRGYVREKIPKLSDCRSFERESLNRRIVMYLNYCGCEGLSALLLRIKNH